MGPGTQRLIKLGLNAGALQLVWFAGVLGGNVPALLACLLALGNHWWWEKRPSAWLALFAVALLGSLADAMVSLAGAATFAGAPQPIPLWLITIWIAFGSTLDQSLGWLKGRYLLAMVLGAIFGPLNYWTGVKMGAATIAWQEIDYLVLMGFIWACLMPLCAWLYHQIIRSSCPLTRA